MNSIGKRRVMREELGKKTSIASCTRLAAPGGHQQRPARRKMFVMVAFLPEGRNFGGVYTDIRTRPMNNNRMSYKY
jgi:hypothetical protein